MNLLSKAAEWWRARKITSALTALKSAQVTFSTTSERLPEEWYLRHGYPGFAAALGGTSPMKVGAFFACVKVIAEDVSTQPFHLYRKARGMVERADSHRLYRVLHDLANPEMSSGTFIEAMTARALVEGTAYARIVRNSQNQIVALYPIDNEKVERYMTSGGRTLQFKVGGETVPGSEIFDLAGFSWDGRCGMSTAEYARATLALATKQTRYADLYFDADHTPGVVLEHPGTLPVSAVEKIKAAWQQMVQSHGVGVLQEGMKVNVVGRTNIESQLLEQRRFQVIEVCRWMRLSPHKLGDMERMTFSNVEQLNIDHLTNVLSPWNRRWKQAVYRCLLSEEERESGYYAEMSVEQFQRGDFRTQTEGFRSLLAAGVYSINEVRAWFNLNPVPGGDERFIQMNMQDIVSAAAGDPGTKTVHNGG